MLFESRSYVTLIGRYILYFSCSCLVRESAEGDASFFVVLYMIREVLRQEILLYFMRALKAPEVMNHVTMNICREPLVCRDLQLSLGKSYTVTQRTCESTRRFGFEYPVSSPESYNEENSFSESCFYP